MMAENLWGHVYVGVDVKIIGYTSTVHLQNIMYIQMCTSMMKLKATYSAALEMWNAVITTSVGHTKLKTIVL